MPEIYCSMYLSQFLLQGDSHLKAYLPIIQDKPVYPIIYVLISLAGWQPFEGIFTNFTQWTSLSNHLCFDLSCRVTAIWRHIYQFYSINQFIQSSVFPFLLQGDSRLKTYLPIIKDKLVIQSSMFWFLLLGDSHLKAYLPIIQDKPVYPIIYVLITLAGWQPFEGIFTYYTR